MKQFLSLKQMRLLIKLGVDVSHPTYYYIGEIIDGRGRKLRRYDSNYHISMQKHTMTTGCPQTFEYVPCFSLVDIIEILPKEINIKGDLYYLRIDNDSCTYAKIGNYCYHDGANYYIVELNENVIDACYDALILLLTSKILNF